jgi:hypothetical protein
MRLSHLRKSFNEIHHCTNLAFTCTTVHFHSAVKLATSIASAVQTKDSPTEQDQGWRVNVSGLHPTPCVRRKPCVVAFSCWKIIPRDSCAVFCWRIDSRSACRSRLLRRLLYSEADVCFCTLQSWNLFDSRSSLVFLLHSSFCVKSQAV